MSGAPTPWPAVREALFAALDQAGPRRDFPFSGALLTMHYLVIEHFRDGDPVPVYRRFRERGRQMPEGLTYVSSWITEELARCYQVMECADRALLEEWMRHWDDLMDFEVFPVLTSAEVQARMAPRLAT